MTKNLTGDPIPRPFCVLLLLLKFIAPPQICNSGEFRVHEGTLYQIQEECWTAYQEDSNEGCWGAHGTVLHTLEGCAIQIAEDLEGTEFSSEDFLEALWAVGVGENVGPHSISRTNTRFDC